MMTKKIESMQLPLLMAIVTLYSFSFAWPKTVGPLEMVIGVLLIGWLFRAVQNLIYFNKPMVSLIFFTLLIVPSVIGIFYSDNAIASVMRDVIPYFYITMPLIFLAEPVHEQILKKILKYLPLFLSFTGMIFAIREFSYNDFTALITTSTYLMQSPVVLFTAIFCSLYTIEYFLKQQYRYALMYSIPGLVTVAIVYFTVLRAPIALWLLSIVFYMVIKKLIWRNVIYIVLGVITILVFFEIISYGAIALKATNYGTTSANRFLIKQQEHGANGKIEELILAKELILHNKNTREALLGKGFGGKWYSPAVGGKVGFTHSLLTYMILKMGLFGLAVFCIYLFWIIKVFFALMRNIFKNNKDPILLLAILGVFSVNIWLEPGYKTLDFGIISLLYFSYYRIVQWEKTLNGGVACND